MNRQCKGINSFVHLWMALVVATWCGMAQAQVPDKLNYQGYLTDPTGAPITGSRSMVFTLYDAGGAAQYAETQAVKVANGVFNVAIGSTTALNLPFDIPYFLGVKVGTDAEMTPRQAVLSSPYAQQAEQLGGLPAARYVASDANGNVGIGTNTPTNKLYVLSSTPGISAIYGESGSGRGVWGKSFGSRGVYGESTNSEGVYGTSSNGAGVYGASTSPTGSGVYARNLSGGRAITAEGDAIQSRDKGGWVKAMLSVGEFGDITRCYNGITNSSTGGCGFSIAHSLNGLYTITFNFQVDDRFVSVTPQANSPLFQSHASFTFTGSNLVEVQTALTSTGSPFGTPPVESFLASEPFMIIIY